MTLPQILGIMKHIKRHIELKIGQPLGGGSSDGKGGETRTSFAEQASPKPATIEQLNSLVAMFGGLGT